MLDELQMYEELVKRIRGCSYSDPNGCEECRDCTNAENYYECKQKLALQAADAIEELSRAKEELAKRVAYWQAQLIQAMCGETLAELEKPRWVSVTEALPESVDDDVLVTDGEGCAVGYWRPDAQAWDSTDFGWLENRSEPPCGIHTVTHWMPLPPLPEPPKEEAK